MIVGVILSSNGLEKVKNFQELFDDIDIGSASKYDAVKHRIKTTMYVSGCRVIHIVIVLCLPIPSTRTLSFISKLKARSVSKVNAISANANTILFAINKRINTNINEGSKADQGEALQVLLHVWSYYFMGYWTE